MATSRNFKFFLLFSLLGIVLFFPVLKALAALALGTTLYSHIPLVPLVSAGLLFSRRREIFSTVGHSVWLGGVMAALGIGLLLAGKGAGQPLVENDSLSLASLGVVLFLNGGFLISFGSGAFRRALFPLCFLVFVVPLPVWLLERMVAFLQQGSANATQGWFELLGVDYTREGDSFYLQSIGIKVAKECSGIRSWLALFITGSLMGNIFLRSGWRRALLLLSTVPIAMVKNGLRITVLTLLGAFVDEAFLGRSTLHTSGGIPFFGLSLGGLAVTLWLLRRAERKR